MADIRKASRVALLAAAIAAITLAVVVEPPVRAADAAPRARAAVHSGPMLGPLDYREATIWLQTTRDARVELHYWPEVDARPKAPAARRLQTSAAGDHIALFAIPGLEPGTRYRYEVSVDGAPLQTPEPLAFRTRDLWEWRTDPPAFSVMMGSCFYVNDPPYDRPGTPFGSDFEILDAMAKQQPEAMLWLGDNIYLREVDWNTRAGIRYRWRHARGLPALQPLLRATQHWGTWDDHDYGPNDSDASYPLKGEALSAFADYFPAPSRGLPGTPGVFTRHSWGDVEFYLTDGRYHRRPQRWPDGPDKAYLGRVQLDWLKEALLSSRATFKVIAFGSQALNPLNRFEVFAGYPEYQELVDWIVQRRIEGVVFVSGDIHRTELLKVVPAGGYPLYDYTSSSLTAGLYPRRPNTPEYDHPNRVPGTALDEHNFGVLRFEGPRRERKLILRAHDKTGALRWEHVIPRSELAFPKQP